MAATTFRSVIIVFWKETALLLLLIMNTYIHQNGRVTDRERQYKQQTDTYIMLSQSSNHRKVLMHRTTQRTDEGNINSMGSNANLGTQGTQAELI